MIKAMTEQEKAALVGALEVLKPEIASCPALVKAVEIALASLTAEPKHARPFGCDGKTLIECEPNHEHCIDIYTTPPVPVIKPVKLPKVKHPAQFDYADEVAEVLKQAGIQIEGDE